MGNGLQSNCVKPMKYLVTGNVMLNKSSRPTYFFMYKKSALTILALHSPPERWSSLPAVLNSSLLPHSPYTSPKSPFNKPQNLQWGLLKCFIPLTQML